MGKTNSNPPSRHNGGGTSNELDRKSTTSMNQNNDHVPSNENVSHEAETTSNGTREELVEEQSVRVKEQPSTTEDASSPKEASLDTPIEEEMNGTGGTDSRASEGKKNDMSVERVMVPPQQENHHGSDSKDDHVQETLKDSPPEISSPPTKTSPTDNKEESPPSFTEFKSPHFEIELPDGILSKLKSNITTQDEESLDEDDIGTKLIQTDKAVTERVHQIVLPNLCEDSQDEQEFQRVYQQEEDYMLMQHNFKHAVHGVEKKAANWLRKALGMKRRHFSHGAAASSRPKSSHAAEPHSPGSHHGDESDHDPDGTPERANRRLTRGMVRSTRIRKREERVVRENQGLEALVSAVKELEGQHGPFPTFERNDSPPRKRSRSVTSSATRNSSRKRNHDDSSSPSKSSKGVKRKRQGGTTPQSASKKSSEPTLLWATLPPRGKKRRSETVCITRIVVNGRRVRAPPQESGADESGEKTPRKILSSKKKKSSSTLSRASSLPLHGSPLSDETEEEQPKPRRKRRKNATATLMSVDPDNLYNPLLPEGRLFGEMVGKRRIMSLSLLDWKRRQQWSPDMINKKAKPTAGDGTSVILPARVIKAGIDAGLPSWESVNPIPRVPREPSSAMEPSRRRHSNATYASWCSKLINCINGSGRMMAHYEFFYSDIDRAWYNMNIFKAEVAKLGIPPTTKLTRSEWSLVRRQIRQGKRPRRFSQKFVQSQMVKLDRYRVMARSIQNGKASEKQKKSFGYDVPAPIRVGSIVTAFNKKARLLHRGIVLARDVVLAAYLVQFERKELGYEFCSDMDVASHGVPEILMTASNTSLDGTSVFGFSNHHSVPGALAYGTSYGALAEFRHRDSKAQAIQRLVIRSLEPAEEDGDDGSLGATLAAPYGRIVTQDGDYSNINDYTRETNVGDMPNNTEQQTLIEKVAEREMLVKIIGIVGNALRRKAMLLDAMDKCSYTLEMYMKVYGDQAAESPGNVRAMKENYSWLHSNLGLTNRSLESALVHLQVMYSRAYAVTPFDGDPYNVELNKNKMDRIIAKACVETNEVCEEGSVEWHLPWAKAISEQCAATGQQMSSLTLLSMSDDKTEEDNEAGTAPSVTTDDESNPKEDDTPLKCREKFLERRLESASQLLLALSYGCDSYTRSVAGTRDASKQPPLWGPKAIRDASSSLLENLNPKPLARVGGHEEENKVLRNLDAERQSAFRELKEAMFLLEAEVAAQHTCKALEV